MSAKADDIPVIMSSHRYIEMLGETLKIYEVVAGRKMHPEKSMVLRIGTWKSKSIPSNRMAIVGHWTHGPVKMI